jgi:cytochrome c-type biogenesis protein CcmH
MRRFVIFFLVLFAAPAVLAIDQDVRFTDPEKQARYERLISEVRCLQCQNQSIKDSNVSLAADLRREIARMIEEGQTDEEIADFLVTRYGEFALYRPRVTGKTLALWVAPFLLVLFGGVALVRVVRHRMSLPIDDEPSAEA